MFEDFEAWLATGSNINLHLWLKTQRLFDSFLFVCKVILAGRSASKGKEALEELLKRVPNAKAPAYRDRGLKTEGYPWIPFFFSQEQ